jgi:tRNA-uridine 2-sulfurtransferase
VNFVKDYWNEVFVPFLDAYRSGIETPNPDVMCNRFIKFHRFREYLAKNIGIRYVCSGMAMQTR